jgi:hypothetical protein
MRLHRKGMSISEISDLTGLPEERVRQIIDNQANK